MLLKCNIKCRVERMMLFVELGSLLYTITLFPFYQVATGMNNFIKNSALTWLLQNTKDLHDCSVLIVHYC